MCSVVVGNPDELLMSENVIQTVWNDRTKSECKILQLAGLTVSYKQGLAFTGPGAK